jgi:hypothetical protein
LASLFVEGYVAVVSLKESHWSEESLLCDILFEAKLSELTSELTDTEQSSDFRFFLG